MLGTLLEGKPGASSPVIPAPVAYERPVKAEKLVVGSACVK